MGSRSASKSSRTKALGAPGANRASVKSGNINDKQSRGDETEETDDLSILRKSVGTSVGGLAHALKVFQSGTQEIRSLLSQECKVIYECRVCENLFRSLANFLSHKRIYCPAVALASRPTGSSPSQPNGLLPHTGQPGSGSELPSDGTLEMVIVEPEPPKRHHNESPEHWICNESTPPTDAAMIDPLPKLEYSVTPIRRRKDICGVIEKLSKRASRQNLANATAVASHLAALSGGKMCLDNAVTTSTSNTLYMENISETKNAVYQTLLCKTSSSMKLNVPSSNAEHSKMLALRGLEGTSSEIPTKDRLAMATSLPNLPIVSDQLSDPDSLYNESHRGPLSPVPHDLLLKKRVALLKEVISQSEKVVLGPDGVVIPPIANGPAFPPEVCLGGVSNSEGEEVEDDDEEGVDAASSSKGKSKGDVSKDSSPEGKREIICSLCKARFSTRKTLSHHMKSLHVMFRTYFRCPCCKNCFANNWSVYRHLYKVHRKTTDQVRKLRALIKKKSFRKKILLPLPSSSAEPITIPSNSNRSNDDTSNSVSSAIAEKTSLSSSGKQPSSMLSSAGRMPTGPGRSGSPLPPPSEATQFPAISAHHAQVLRKLENIVKQEDNHWKLESFPERPGMGKSCPGCNRRFERRAALASHAHSCHKRILLAAQKASRARNKQQQQKANKAVSGGKGVKGTDELEKDILGSKDSPIKLEKQCEEEITLEKHPSVSTDSEQSGLVKIYCDESQNAITSSLGISSKLSSSDTNALPEKLREEDWEEMERPNSAASIGSQQDNNSPLTIPSQSGKQQRIGIQIRKDYVKTDRGSACSSGTSPTPYSASQIPREDEEADDEIVILSSTLSKNPMEMGTNCSKDSLAASADICSDPEGSSNSDPDLNSSDQKKHCFEKKELVLQLEDILSRKKVPDSDSTFQVEDDNYSEEQISCSVKKEEPTGDCFEKPQVEGIIGSHGEVKRVFLEVIVGGVADPNSLTVDEEENENLAEEKVIETKREKRELIGTNSRRTATVRGKLPSSSTAVQRLGGRPVRNRVKVEREDFIYDLSDMRLSPAKREDFSSSGSHGLSFKRPRRNVPQQQFLSNPPIEGSSSLKQAMASGVIKMEVSNKTQSSSTLPPDGGHTLRVYSGKASGCSLSTDRPNKVPISTSGAVIPTSAGSHKLSDCRVVIGGLRSGDVTQLSVRRVYGSRKILTPSNMTPVAVEHEDVSFSSLKKYGRNKECSVGLGDVDEGLFGEMGKGEVSISVKQTGKGSLLYQSDSLDSTDSLSDCGNVAQRKNPIGHGELKPKT